MKLRYNDIGEWEYLWTYLSGVYEKVGSEQLQVKIKIKRRVFTGLRRTR